MIVSRQTRVSGLGGSVVVDPEACLPYDMRTELLWLLLPGGEGDTFNCAPVPTQSRQGWDRGDRRRTAHVRLEEARSYGRA
jgi:hypothetical protein